MFQHVLSNLEFLKIYIIAFVFIYFFENPVYIFQTNIISYGFEKYDNLL